MAGLFFDAGIYQLWQNAVGTGSSGIYPGEVGLVTTNPTLVPSLIYSSFSWASYGVLPWVVPSFVLDTTTHKVNATHLYSWTIDGSHAGDTLYGIGVYTSAGPLFYVEYFPSPYVVPSGGGSFSFLLNWYYSDCVYH